VAARYRADVGVLRDLVCRGVLGEPRLAEVSWVRARGIPRAGWSTAAVTAGGGVLLDLGWHVLDVVHWLWPATAVRSAAACSSSDFLRTEGWTATWQGDDQLRDAATPTGERDVEDQLTGFVDTDRFGLSVRLAWASHETLDRTVLTLHGTEGTARLSTTFGFSPARAEPSLELCRGGTVEQALPPEAEVGDEYARHLDALVDELVDPASTTRALDSARWVLSVTDALYGAARRH
jgi:oxidoreductase